MTRILEHRAKELLERAGVQVPRGQVAASPEEAASAARELGGAVVVKALIASNRRAKAGGVRFAEDAAAAAEAAATLLDSDLLGLKVAQVLVEEQLTFGAERYLAFALDDDRGLPIALVSAAGGVDIEDVAEPPLVLPLDPWGRDLPHAFRSLWRRAGVTGAELTALTTLTVRAAACFFDLDATLLELNPVACTESGAVAVGALVELDELAAARHPGLVHEPAGAERGRPATALELEAAAVAAVEPYRGTAKYIELEGDIGMLVGGGGGSLVFVDAVRRAGGRPACYTEIGGNPSAEKVRGLTRVVLRTPGVRGLLVGHNITNNTQVDLVARGVVDALADLGLDARTFPVVAREVGTNDDVGRAIFEQAGVEVLGMEWTMDRAGERIVERVGSLPR